MRRFDRIVVGGFVSVSVVAFVLGLGAIIYAHSVIEPRMAKLSEQAVTGVELAERGLRVLEAHTNELETLIAPRQSVAATTSELPAVLEQSTNLTWHAAQTLDQSAQTLRSVAEATELVLPDDAIERSAETMSTTAASLEGLAPRLNALREETQLLADDLTRASSSTKQLQDELRQANVTLEQAREQLGQTHETLSEANLPAEISRLASLHGGLYIVLAMLLAGMAGLWKRLSEQPAGD